MMINFIMILFKLASQAFKHFVPAILKAFHVLTVLCALFQFSIDFAFCLRCVCKTTINHSNNSNILEDESIGGSSGSISGSSSTTISLWNVLKLLHFVRSFVSLFTYRLFFLSSRNRSSYSTKLYNRKILTFKKNKWHTKFAAETNFCDVIYSLFRCKRLNNKHIALVIFNGCELNANRKKKRNLKKKEWAFFHHHHHITIPMIWLWIFFCSFAVRLHLDRLPNSLWLNEK